jgi:hypothetical protein
MISNNNNDNEDDKTVNALLFSSQKEKLVNFLKCIQDYGVKSMQHLSKPSVYSGSWLENIKNIEDLYQYLNTLNSTEAVIRVFNLLSPYQNSFPQGKGQETDMAIYFNEGAKANNGNNGKMIQNMNSENIIHNNESIHNKSQIENQNKILEEQKAEISSLKGQIKNITTKFEENSKKEIEIQNMKSN